MNKRISMYEELNGLFEELKNENISFYKHFKTRVSKIRFLCLGIATLLMIGVVLMIDNHLINSMIGLVVAFSTQFIMKQMILYHVLQPIETLLEDIE